jgi:hypothetical protein
MFNLTNYDRDLFLGTAAITIATFLPFEIGHIDPGAAVYSFAFG